MSEPTVETTEAQAPEGYAEYVRFRRGETPTPEAEPEKPAQEPAEAVETQPETPKEESAPSEEEQESADPDRPKGKGGFQRRIDKLTAKIHELEGKLAPVAAPPKAEEAKPEGKPVLDKFDSYDAYIEALTDWKVEQHEKTRRDSEVKAKAEAEVRTKVTAWEQSQTAAREKHDDYDDAVEAVSHIKVPPTVQRAIVESDSKAELAYHLAKNPGELERIVALEPLKAAIELGKLEAKLTQPAEPKPKASSAPKPPKPVTPVGTPVRTIYDTDDYMAYRKLRMAELAKR